MTFDENDFEQELRNALPRREPANGFAERVIGRVSPARKGRPMWALMALAASLAVGITGVARYEEYRKAEHAKEQLMLALRITARTLDTVERKLNE